MTSKEKLWARAFFALSAVYAVLYLGYIFFAVWLIRTDYLPDVGWSAWVTMFPLMLVVPTFMMVVLIRTLTVDIPAYRVKSRL